MRNYTLFGGLAQVMGIWFISNQPFLLRDQVSFYCILFLCCQQVWCVMCSPSISFIHSLPLYDSSAPLALHLQLHTHTHRTELTSSQHFDIMCANWSDESSAYFTIRISRFSVKAWLTDCMDLLYVKANHMYDPEERYNCWSTEELWGGLVLMLADNGQVPGQMPSKSQGWHIEMDNQTEHPDKTHTGTKGPQSADRAAALSC